MNVALKLARDYYDRLPQEAKEKVMPKHLLTAIQIAEQRMEGKQLIRSAIEGALVLADCLADTKDDPEAFKSNNDNYMRIKDALASVTKPEGE